MSTTTVSVSSTTSEASVEEVRSREAEAREAARLVAERAALDEERRAAREREALRSRVDVANRVIAEQESLFQRLLARLDEAARRLPDLSLQAPTLPSLQRGMVEDPEKLEAWCARLTTAVGEFSRQLDVAIADAERLLRRRVAKAAAWRTAADLEQQALLRIEASRVLAGRLKLVPKLVPLPGKAPADAELEAVELYVGSLRRALAEIDRQYVVLVAREDARERAAALAGAALQTRAAAQAHAEHEAMHKARARAALLQSLSEVLSATGLVQDDLSPATRFLIDDALAHSDISDRREQLARWVTREQQRREGVDRALALMQSAPDLVHADASLAQRWSVLLAHLQRVAGNIDEFTPHVEREYEQICADARRNLKSAFTKADWVLAMSEQGFEILERDDGQGLVVIDLDHPEVWLEGEALESDEGGFGAVLELRTDSESSAEQDSAITSSVCSRLSEVAGAAAGKVQTQAEVIERKERITRSRRPAMARQAFATGR